MGLPLILWFILRIVSGKLAKTSRLFLCSLCLTWWLAIGQLLEKGKNEILYSYVTTLRQTASQG